MALRNAQGQRGKYLTRKLSSTRNPVEDMYAIVSKFQSAKIGVLCYSLVVLGLLWLVCMRHLVWPKSMHHGTTAVSRDH